MGDARDPLVELARLIAQGDPFVESAASPPLAPSCSHAVQEHGYKKASAGSRYFSWLAADVESTHRRSSLLLVLGVLGLAIVGTAGVFGYRAIFGGPVASTFAPISKANKIAPVSAVLEAKSATNTDQAGTTTTGSTEDPVSREEQSVKPEPRVIRTIPITPDEGWLRGAAAPAPPGAVQTAPNQAMPGPVMSVWPPPPAMAAPTAPTAAAPVPAPPAKVLSEPKKIHAVANRADQSGAADASRRLRPI